MMRECAYPADISCTQGDGPCRRVVCDVAPRPDLGDPESWAWWEITLTDSDDSRVQGLMRRSITTAEFDQLNREFHAQVARYGHATFPPTTVRAEVLIIRHGGRAYRAYPVMDPAINSSLTTRRDPETGAVTLGFHGPNPDPDGGGSWVRRDTRPEPPP